MWRINIYSVSVNPYIYYPKLRGGPDIVLAVFTKNVALQVKFYAASVLDSDYESVVFKLAHCIVLQLSISRTQSGNNLGRAILYG